jgi:hypothetical protein
LVGKRPNHAESALIALAKVCGFREGRVIKTYVKWKKRSLKRANLDSDSDYFKFYPNCVWGPFKGGGPYEMDLVFPNIIEPGGVDFEIDGVNWHKKPEQLERDTKRDAVLKANGWIVVRIKDSFLYSKLVPLLNDDLRGGLG